MKSLLKHYAKPDSRSSREIWIKILLKPSCTTAVKICRFHHITETVCHLNSLWPSDAIWRHTSWSTLAQVMAWCRQATSHNLRQCYLDIIDIHQRKILMKMHGIWQLKAAPGSLIPKFFLGSLRGHWVNNEVPVSLIWDPNIIIALPADVHALIVLGHVQIQCWL